MHREFEPIGSYLVRCRNKKHLTQVDIAQHLGVTAQVVSNVERGHAGPPGRLLSEWVDLVGANSERIKRELLKTYRGRIDRMLSTPINQSA